MQSESAEPHEGLRISCVRRLMKNPLPAHSSGNFRKLPEHACPVNHVFSAFFLIFLLPDHLPETSGKLPVFEAVTKSICSPLFFFVFPSADKCARKNIRWRRNFFSSADLILMREKKSLTGGETFFSSADKCARKKIAGDETFFRA